MYFGGISIFGIPRPLTGNWPCILGYFNFWDSRAFDRPDFNASRNISISGKISSIDIVQKSATSPVWCTI